MKRHNIQHFASKSDQKAAVVDRFNRSIKKRIWPYLSDCGTVCWIDVIHRLVDAYNASQHRSIGMAPADVNKHHEDRIWTRLYGDCDTSNAADATWRYGTYKQKQRRVRQRIHA